MIVHDLEKILFEELGIASSVELRHDSDIPCMNGRVISEVNSALFIKDIPIAYFSRFSDVDPDKIKDLHQKVWSESKTPLLFVTLPHEIRIYNGYESTPLPNEELDTPSRLLQQLTNLTDHLTAREQIRKKLVETHHYERIYLETGAFWDTTEGRRINHKTRADRQLVAGMGQMRQQLRNAGLSNHVAYTLLGRSLFIRYLEDRGILTSDWVEQMTDGQASSYRDALNSREISYILFDRLSTRFNGDLFPIEEVEKEVNESHLEILLSFLNRTNLETGQLSLWPYNFEYIPIELISHIYDTFIENQRASGAYYTPLLLADFILSETIGEDVIRSDMTILDPACGSGIFLVGAYRRLIHAWRQYRQPTPTDLSRILQQSIFGVDKNREAVRIAAFGLYLEILNHLSNQQIRDESFQFPPLQPKNLLVHDFFAEKEVDHHFTHKFDRVVGNMPWGQGTLTKTAQKWLAKHNYTVGGKQAAPAFMLRAPQFCKDNGEIALLTSSKSSIFVTSQTHQKFRSRFFTTYDVRAVVNFSAMRQELFEGAISPIVAIFYSANEPVLERKLIYAVPKPSPLSQHIKAIILDTTEIKFLSRRELLSFPQLWKVALWGTSRDAALIKRLNSLPSLREQAKNLEWVVGEGIQINGGDENPAPWLKNINLVPTGQLRPYFIDLSVGEKITNQVFHRPRIPKLTKAPLVLIHQSQCSATFSDTDVAYRHKISGVAGKKEQEWLLLWLVAYLNSPLAKYYHFLTSTSWAVERGTIIQWEYEEMPFLLPNKDDPRLLDILHHLDRIKTLLNEKNPFFNAKHDFEIRKIKGAINTLVYELYGLHPIEQQLVEDTLEYGLGYFNWMKRKNRKPQGAKAVQRPDIKMLQRYATIFVRAATSFLRIKEQTLNATIYQNGAPLTVVSFEIVGDEEAKAVQLVTESNAMRTKLRELDEFLLARKTPSMYIRRHLRVYDGNQVSLVRPSEQRFWTPSQARIDADAFLAELLS